MSLWCGSCRKEIFDGFGILYRLGRTARGALLYPDKAKDYVPPNSAICDDCWASVPSTEKANGEKAKTEVEGNRQIVFAYAPADSNNDPFWKSKTWSGIVTQDGALTFLTPEAAAHYLSGAVEIIDRMERDLERRQAAG